MFPTTTSVSLLDGLRGGGNPRAWQDFFRAYAPPLAMFAKRCGLSEADAGDAVQETLIAVYQAFRDSAEPYDRSRARFKSWLRGVALHKVHDVQRRRARQERVAAGPIPDVDERLTTSAMEVAFEIEWRRGLLARALEHVAQEIDPTVYQAFELYALREEPPDKVAKLLGITRNAVYISKTRVLQRLRAALAELKAAED